MHHFHMHFPKQSF